MTQAVASKRWWIVVAVVVAAAAVGAALWVTSNSSRTSVTAEDAAASSSPSAGASGSPQPSDPAATPSALPQLSPRPQSAQSPSSPVVIVPGIAESNALPPVDFDQTAPVQPGVTAAITGVAAIDGVGTGIGEISGPALAFTVTVANTTASPFDTAAVTVNCYDSADVPCIPLLSDTRNKPLPTGLAPGASATAVYVFGVPLERRTSATLAVSLGPTAPTVIFRGALPGVS